MVEGHGVEARSNQPYAQDPGMSLCESMYGPHVLVCVRVRGVFQKKRKKKRRIRDGVKEQATYKGKIYSTILVWY